MSESGGVEDLLVLRFEGFLLSGILCLGNLTGQDIDGRILCESLVPEDHLSKWEDTQTKGNSQADDQRPPWKIPFGSADIFREST